MKSVTGTGRFRASRPGVAGMTEQVSVTSLADNCPKIVQGVDSNLSLLAKNPIRRTGVLHLAGKIRKKGKEAGGCEAFARKGNHQPLQVPARRGIRTG